MKRGKNSKDLKEKLLFLICLGALVGSLDTELYATSEKEYTKDYREWFENNIGDNDFTSYTEENSININDENIGREGGILVSNKDSISNDVELETKSLEVNFAKDVNITTTKGMVGVFVDANTNSSNNPRNVTAKFNSNLTINNTFGYALYSKATSSPAGATASIIVNENNNPENIIQIIGNLRAESLIARKGNNKAEIELNLSNEDSFFSGDMVTMRDISKDGETDSEIRLNLSNKATWYVGNHTLVKDEDGYKIESKSNYTINGTIKEDLTNEEKQTALKTFITSNGGVIDIYHGSPNTSFVEKTIDFLEATMENTNDENTKKEIEAMIDSLSKQHIEGSRKLTLNGVEDRLKDTTFRISTDVENGKSDLIVLNDVNITAPTETYHIEIAADYIENGKWEIDPNSEKIYVMDINGEGLDKITVVGEEYETILGAGLKKQTVTPTIAEDGEGSGDWYLAAVDKTEEKGDGHIFVELGAATNAGMAAAWRADNSDLYQRMGNLRNKEAEQGVWGRIYTGENEVRKGMDLDLEYRAVQVGYDWKEKTDKGKLFKGIAFGYFDGETDYNHGSGEADSATVGLYATYIGENGSYRDFIIKYGRLDNELSYGADDGNHYKADYDTYGISAEAEYGHRYELDNNYYIEPLAQLSYIYIDDEDYTMKLNEKDGARVSNDDYQSLIGYAGFHYGKQFENNNVAYLRVAVAHEFMGDIDVSAKYQDVHVKSDINGDDTWVEYGVGFDAMVKEDTAIYGRLQRSTGDVVRTKWHASLGIRYTF